jgi:hypothetical protein
VTQFGSMPLHGILSLWPACSCIMPAPREHAVMPADDAVFVVDQDRSGETELPHAARRSEPANAPRCPASPSSRFRRRASNGSI